MRNIRKEFPGIIANDNITLGLKKGEIHRTEFTVKKRSFYNELK